MQGGERVIEIEACRKVEQDRTEHRTNLYAGRGEGDRGM